jgi:hypothetical protein
VCGRSEAIFAFFSLLSSFFSPSLLTSPSLELRTPNCGAAAPSFLFTSHFSFLKTNQNYDAVAYLLTSVGWRFINKMNGGVNKVEKGVDKWGNWIYFEEN